MSTQVLLLEFICRGVQLDKKSFLQCSASPCTCEKTEEQRGKLQYEDAKHGNKNGMIHQGIEVNMFNGRHISFPISF